MELIAGALPTFLEGGMAQDENMLSAIPLGSFAGIALTVLPWLLGGGALHLHHGFDPDTFAAQCRTQDGGTIVLPGPVLSALAEAGLLGDAIRSIIALWRAPERLAACAPWHGAAALVDVAGFSEIGLLAARRGADGMPAAIPCGVVLAPRGGAAPITAAETMRTAAGTLALRGPMVPAYAFPPGAERGQQPHLNVDAAGYVDTGFACRLDRDTQMLVVTGPPGGITTVGGYRFRQSEVDWQVAHADLDATIVALPDGTLGQRLAGSSPDRQVTIAELQARGANPLISGAFRPRQASEAA